MVEIKNLSKTFVTKDGVVEALKDINIKIDTGDVYGIIGMSGAGKSTLVRCINMLERPSSGQVIVDNVDIGSLNSADLRKARRDITMIFQQFNLLMQRTCLKNICFPMEISGVPKDKAEKRAKELLDLVGLPSKANAYPSQLSGGQQQRVAIARALATNPKVLLCDEATSALDPNTTHSILSLIKEINEKLKITVIIITHQMSVVEEVCNKVAILDNGEVVEEGLVAEIFKNPKTMAAKRLVYPGGDAEHKGFIEGERLIRLAFNGTKSTDKPLVAGIALDTGAMLSVISADSSVIDGQIYGTMLLGLPKDEVLAQKALDYLGKYEGISFEEVVKR